MTFKDLKFKKHSVVEGIQATLEIKPKVFISVVAGDGMYSNGKTGNRNIFNFRDSCSISCFTI